MIKVEGDAGLPTAILVGTEEGKVILQLPIPDGKPLHVKLSPEAALSIASSLEGTARSILKSRQRTT